MCRLGSTALYLLPLLVVVLVTAAGQDVTNNPALHRLNDRVILESFKGDNEVVCTFCLFQVLAAAYQLGNEQVRREIRDALGTRNPEALSEELLVEAGRTKTLSGTLTGYYQRGAFDGCPVRTKREQCASIASILRRQGEAVDFRRPGTVSFINEAVEKATGGEIKDLFTSLPSNTKLVFASTMVFHNEWETRLMSSDANFKLADGKIVSVPTLLSEDPMRVLDSPDGVQGVAMAYEDKAIKLYCFKSKREDQEIRHLLYQQHYLDLAQAPFRFTQVRIPKFDIVSKMTSYVKFVELMGMPEMFRGGLGGHDGLKVDQLVQKAVIQTDEHGTRAAGAAGISFIPLSAQPVEFLARFDRPFVCSLVHKELVQPLFTAYIADPRAQ